MRYTYLFEIDGKEPEAHTADTLNELDAAQYIDSINSISVLDAAKTEIKRYTNVSYTNIGIERMAVSLPALYYQLNIGVTYGSLIQTTDEMMTLLTSSQLEAEKIKDVTRMVHELQTRVRVGENKADIAALIAMLMFADANEDTKRVAYHEQEAKRDYLKAEHPSLYFFFLKWAEAFTHRRASDTEHIITKYNTLNAMLSLALNTPQL